MAGSVGPTDAVVDRRRSTPACARRRRVGPVADAEPVRPRRRAAARRASCPTPTDCRSRMSVVPLFCLLAAALFVLAARTYEADLRAASPTPTRPARRTRAPGRMTAETTTPCNERAVTPSRAGARAQARERQLESRLGAVRQARPGVDREGDRDGDRAGRRRRARREDDRARSASRSTRRARTCTRRACAATSSARCKAGATKEEITAVLQLASLQGLHSMCLGAPILLEELAATTRRRLDLTSTRPPQPRTRP